MQLGGIASRLALLIGLLAVAFGLTTSAASAKTFKVDKHGDHAPGGCNASDCTLREAVIAATAKAGDDKIKLPSRKPYKLKRSASLPGPDAGKGDLDAGLAPGVGNAFEIFHPGKGRATIDAAKANDRVIELSGSLELKKVVLRHGSVEGLDPSGGGVQGEGLLILRNSKVANNEADLNGGGVFMANGSVVAIRSSFKANTANAIGGGLFVDDSARLTLKKSTLTGNDAERGGGVWIATGLFFGTSQIDASTIDHNASQGDGGGLGTEGGDTIITNSTFTRNQAAGRGGGIYAAPGSESRLNGVTIARNRADADDTGSPDTGGGVFADGGGDAMDVRNTLFADNRRTNQGFNECAAPAPVGFDSKGGNMLTSQLGGCNFFDTPEDFIVNDPKLGRFGDKGGPTLTIPLQAGSPAIDEADGPGALGFDQRGHAREDADVGAYER